MLAGVDSACGEREESRQGGGMGQCTPRRICGVTSNLSPASRPRAALPRGVLSVHVRQCTGTCDGLGDLPRKLTQRCNAKGGHEGTSTCPRVQQAGTPLPRVALAPRLRSVTLQGTSSGRPAVPPLPPHHPTTPPPHHPTTPPPLTCEQAQRQGAVGDDGDAQVVTQRLKRERGGASGQG